MITSFMLNVFLAVVYVALLGRVTFLDFAIGFLISFVVVTIINRVTGGGKYFGRLVAITKFVGYFVVILVKANLQVAWEVITPGFNFTPRILRYPVHGLTDAEVTALASAITLTPGTLSADFDEHTRTLYIHCMYGQDRDAALAELDALRDRLIEEVFDDPA